jgi:hypothetical protein
VGTLLAELKAAPVRDVTRVPDPAGLWVALAGLQTRSESRLIWKANVPPSRVAELVASSAADSLVHAEALNGIVWVHGPEAPRPDAAGGNCVLRRGPVERKRTLPVWGRPTGDRELMRHVKRTLDPKGVFNPGRLFGDL